MVTKQNAPAVASSRQLAFLIIGLLLTCVMWAYCAQLNAMAQKRLDSQGFGRRNFSDLYPRWLGSRELLLHRQNPYTESITTEIQRGYYGRPIDPKRAGDPVDEQRFAYPLFVVLLFAPTVNLPFETVSSIFETLFGAMALLTVWFWAKELQMFRHWTEGATAVVFGIATIPYMQGLVLQQLTIVVALCLGVCPSIRVGTSDCS
jgi:hypothetical protein